MVSAACVRGKCRNGPGDHRGRPDEELAFTRAGRISWTLGPKSVIETIASAGSFLDGRRQSSLPKRGGGVARSGGRVAGKPGPSRPISARKRAYVLNRLKTMGIGFEAEPAGAFLRLG